jgi:hypothetical protein
MVGILFTITLLALLGAVGFLFAWMVRIASNAEQKNSSTQLQPIPVKERNRP